MIWLSCYTWFIAIDHPTAIFVEVFFFVWVLITLNLLQKKNFLQKYPKARHQKGRRNCWYFPSLTKTSCIEWSQTKTLRPTFRRRKLGSRGLNLGREGRTFAPDFSGLIFVDVRSDHGWKKKEGCFVGACGKWMCVVVSMDFWALSLPTLYDNLFFQTWRGGSIKAPKADHVLVPKYGLWNRHWRCSSTELKHGLQMLAAVEQRSESCQNSGSWAA